MKRQAVLIIMLIKIDGALYSKFGNIVGAVA